MESSLKSTGVETSSTKSSAPLLFDERRRPHERDPNVRFRLAKFRQRLWDKRQWKNACFSVGRDVRSFRWFAAFAWLFASAWTVSLGLLLFYLGSNSLQWNTAACQPDGTFDVSKRSYSRWSGSGFFQITLGWGRFSFADAKAIDVAWDVVFGRGGQALLAWISWRAFADYTATSMQVKPATYDTFYAIFLQDQPGIYSTLRLARDFTRRRGLQSRVTMVVVILVAIFVLLFPTLGGAMSGYSANNDAYVKGYGGTLIPLDEFTIVGYVIHDAWRINMTGDFLLTYPNLKNVQEYGFYGLQDKESTWMGQALPAPTLNISASWLPRSDSTYGWNWTDPRTGERPFASFYRAAYAAGNETYGLGYLKANGSCQPMSDPAFSADSQSARESYEWGFSFLQLYILVSLLLAWTLCVASVWLKARMTMRARGRRDVPRGYKGVLELAGAMRKELRDHECDPDGLSHDELHEEIKKRLGGGSIELDKADSPEPWGVWRAAWAYCRDEAWWVVAVLVMIPPCAGLSSVDSSFGWWLLVPVTSTMLAMAVGRSKESRIILLLAGSTLGTVVFLGAWYGTRTRQSRSSSRYYNWYY
ncbi:hypothetical protein CTA2_8224 [Colletotrichum tanaceti]|uniref:Uncharacterized protein n=1 Tax=Colletotrichum tanaceti TaxID=1306861 RepID=A0A4U6X1Q4_9PEZI|nr:hypothetical protein CTA2_8224 [Colletotrichum tanaceti]TKW48679.1 hypothetical protein CTA1_544 [Colletotrichum tanaceti]